MPDAPSFDLFVSYADADRAWVEGYLLDALKQAGVRHHSESAFALGAPRLLEFERAVQQSRRVLLIVSPAFVAGNLSQFVDVLAQSYGAELGTWPVIPLILQPVKLPPRLAMLTALDATETGRWPAVIERLCAELQRPTPEPSPAPPCPYPGMRAFTAAEARFFYGRDEDVREMLQRLRHQRLLFVIGPSGSGKSSLVVAGVLPQLATSSLFPSGYWRVRQMRPGPHPTQTLAEILGGDVGQPADAMAHLLAQHSPAERLLLVIDQFEEIFTQASRAEQTLFLGLLQTLRGVEQCAMLVALRADFYADLMNSELWPVDAAQRLEIAPLRGEALRKAIYQPAADVGVYLDERLLERLLADAANEPGVLPLLQETMALLWQDMQRRLLPFSAYERLGQGGQSGLAVAMALKADATLAELSPGRQKIARRIFLQLIQFGEGRPDTRRQQAIADLRRASDDPQEVSQILEHLTRNRLLTRSGDDEAGGPVVDIAHEMLIIGWPVSRQWVREGRAAELVRRRLEHAAHEWGQHHQDSSFLYQGFRLSEAREWSAENKSDLTEEQVKFMEASERRAAMFTWARRLAIAALVILASIYPLLETRQFLLRRAAGGLMVRFEPGAVELGTSDPQYQRSYPPRQVTLHGFALDSNEVNYKQYRLCVQAGACSPPIEPADVNDFAEADENLPVAWVTAYQAAGYCQWLGQRLPAQAEWERALRGETHRPWPWPSNDPPSPSRVNLSLPDFPDSLLEHSVPVDDPAYAGGATPEGIMHLLGNVREWTNTPNICNDPYSCATPWDGHSKVQALYIVGLSWANGPSLPDSDYVAEALGADPNIFDTDLGFRCADD